MIARRLLWGLALLILVGAFAQTFLRNDPMYDLDILARASERLSAGESPYQLSLDRDEHTKAPLIHPLLAPLHRIPKPALYAGWAALMIACLFWILRQLGHPPWSLTGALLLLFTHVFWFAEFKLGQSNLLILSLLMQAWNKPSFRSGLGLGFALLLKPNLFPLALFFFRKPRRSAFPGALALTAILALAFWALFPERSLLAEHRE